MWTLTRASNHDAQTYNDYASFGFGDTSSIIRGVFAFDANKYESSSSSSSSSKIPLAIDANDVAANPRSVVQFYPYGNCNQEGVGSDQPGYLAPVGTSPFGSLVVPTEGAHNATSNTTAGVYSYSYTQQLEIDTNTTLYSSFLKRYGGEDFLEFCATFLITTGNNSNTHGNGHYASSSAVLASFSADVQVRVPTTYSASYDLANQVVRPNMTSFTRNSVDVGVTFAVESCICSNRYGRSSSLDVTTDVTTTTTLANNTNVTTTTPTTTTTTAYHDYYKCYGDGPNSYLPTFTPGVDLHLCFEPGGWMDARGNKAFHQNEDDSHPDFMELDTVQTWVLQQLSGVTGVDSEGVNIVKGGAFRKAIDGGTPDAITTVQYLHAVPATVPENENDTSNSTSTSTSTSTNTNTVREYRLAGADEPGAKRMAVVSTPINFAFFQVPELPLVVEGTVHFRSKSERRNRHRNMAVSLSPPPPPQIGASDAPPDARSGVGPFRRHLGVPPQLQPQPQRGADDPPPNAPPHHHPPPPPPDAPPTARSGLGSFGKILEEARALLESVEVETHDLALSSRDDGANDAIDAPPHEQAASQASPPPPPPPQTRSPPAPTSGLGSFAMILTLDDSFAVATTAGGGALTRAEAPASPWFVAYILSGILVGLVLIHGLLHLAGIRLVGTGAGAATTATATTTATTTTMGTRGGGLTGFAVPGCGVPSFHRRSGGFEDEYGYGYRKDKHHAHKYKDKHGPQEDADTVASLGSGSLPSLA